VSSGSGKHGHLGSLKAVVELCIFGPSLFGIRAWLCVSNLGRTCRCLYRMTCLRLAVKEFL
jgi:hypothetical protein